MSSAFKYEKISIEDYLADELESLVKHEYVGGRVYALAGARNRHNVITGNIFAVLHARLAGNPCMPFNSDTKVRIQLSSGTRFYYPDVQITCLPNSEDETFQDVPVVIFEVLSDSTMRIDEEEKKTAYLQIPSLRQYILVEQHEPAVVVYERTETGFKREVLNSLDASIQLKVLGISLSMNDIFGSLEFEQ